MCSCKYGGEDFFIYYLDDQWVKVSRNHHSLMAPVRSSSEAKSFTVIKPQTTTSPERYQLLLSNTLKAAHAPQFELIFVNKVCPQSPRKQQYYIDNLPQLLHIHAVKFIVCSH